MSSSGRKFIDSYQIVITTFGGTEGFQEIQHQTIQSENSNLIDMLQNYFTIAFRNLKKHKFYTLINSVGLATGVASCMLILLYITNELSYDKSYTDHDRIYRVETEMKFGDNHLITAATPAPMAETLHKDFPEVQVVARFWNNASMIFRRTEESFKENHTVYADSSVFRVFDIPFIAGDPLTALKEPNTMAISKKAADKYFPGEQALGQTLISNDGKVWKIAGVYENIESNNHFYFDFILALVSEEYSRDREWFSNSFSTYIKLAKGVKAEDLEAKFPKMVLTYAGPQLKDALGADFSYEKFESQGNKLVFTLRPVTDIHLHSDRMAEMGTNSSITYVYLFGTIAGFILLIACINFMNLSTARSSNRAKEVGIRKVMGSLRSHLVRQFLTESVLLSVGSFLVAIVIAWTVMPMFNELALKQLSLPFASPVFWLLLVGGALITGVLAGLYPSFFLSAFRPVNVLKGNVSMGTKSSFIRRGLVVFQFWISIVLVVGTIAVNRQLDYIQTKKIGFNKDQVLVVHDAYALKDQLQSFKDEVVNDNRVQSGSISSFLPVKGFDRSDNVYWPAGKTPTEENMVSLQNWGVGHDYVKTLGMKMVQGRDFSKDFLSDSSGVIVNETAVRMFGYTNENAVGQRITTFGGDSPDVNNYLVSTIVGVVEDFHFESLRQNIGPLGLFLTNTRNMIAFRFEAKEAQDVIKSVENTWKKFGPGLPFEYSFLDEEFGRMYSSEQRLGYIFSIFAVLAIIIACLGLFALTAFTAEQRTKEIGIRKVLGASVSGITVMLSKEFGKLILIAFVLAAPSAWFGIDWWLESYTFKTEIGVTMYALAGITVFGIAWLTISYQSIRAALANPVKSLRSQ